MYTYNGFVIINPMSFMVSKVLNNKTNKMPFKNVYVCDDIGVISKRIHK